MRLFLLRGTHRDAETVRIEGKNYNYLVNALRLKVGDVFAITDDDGTSFNGTIMKIGNRSLNVTLEKKDERSQLDSTDTLPSYEGPRCEIHLYQCICKGKKNEQITKQVTECGASSITFVSSRNCVARKDEKYQERLEAIVEEAVGQSGSPVITKIRPFLDICDVMKDWNKRGLMLFFHQAEIDQKSLGEYLNEIDVTTPIGIIVGSEGGLDDRECEMLISQGAHPVLLKTNILRAETAAVYSVAAVQSLMLEK